MLIDDGLLRFEDGEWRSVEDLANVTVPPTIHLLLAARLDRLDAEERAVIERGAVEGKVFHTGAVTTLSPDAARPNVRSRLLALARKELIRPDRAEFAGEDAFRFRHLLIRDAAYQAMPKEQRADLHERFADWLANVAGERMAEYEEILGHHLEQAYRYRAELGTVDERTKSLAGRAAEHLYASAMRADEREDLTPRRRSSSGASNCRTAPCISGRSSSCRSSSRSSRTSPRRSTPRRARSRSRRRSGIERRRSGQSSCGSWPGHRWNPTGPWRSRSKRRRRSSTKRVVSPTWSCATRRSSCSRSCPSSKGSRARP